MTQDIRVKLATEIMQVTGTVNSVSVTWTRQGDEWLATCEKSDDGRYLVEIKAITAQAKEYNYSFTLYYGLVLITDRTRADVDRASYLISAYNNGTITDEEITEFLTELKGFYDYTDINRVVSAMYYVSEKYREYGYYIPIDSTNSWTMSDYFNQNMEYETYLNDLRKLRRAILVMKDTPQVPAYGDNLTYSKANDIEQILEDLDFLITAISKSLYYSDEIYAGEV